MSCDESGCSLFKKTAQIDKFEIASLIRSYYADANGNVPMRKVKSTNPHFAMYAAQIPCMCAEKRYIFAICPVTPWIQMQKEGHLVDLRQLDWSAFQTRSLKIVHDVPMLPELRTGNQLTSKIITLDKMAEKSMIYNVEDLPLRIELLDIKYSTKGDVKTALETYNTLLTWK